MSQEKGTLKTTTSGQAVPDGAVQLSNFVGDWCFAEHTADHLAFYRRGRCANPDNIDDWLAHGGSARPTCSTGEQRRTRTIEVDHAGQRCALLGLKMRMPSPAGEA
jgi:hypothetical protein